MSSLRSPEYQEFVSRLIDARKKSGITQAELAEQLGKPQSFVSKYERLERRLDVVEYVRIASQLGIEPLDLFISSKG
ncbi:MAG: transcriptional regulator [Nevskiales bacterium]|nr:transcriptional regulator [Nevskiales bacterium]